MKEMKRKTAGVLICVFMLLLSLTVCRAENTEGTASDYRDLLLSFDYGDEITYVIGHKSPDSDTVGSAAPPVMDQAAGASAVIRRFSFTTRYKYGTIG